MEALLVSDHEREYAVGLLRRHWLAGRLTSDEFEQRVGEALRARFTDDLWRALRFLPVDPPRRACPSGGGLAVASLVTGVFALLFLMGSFGLLFIVTLPMSVTAWALGREARRVPHPSRPGLARAGEVIGIVGAAFSALMLAGCAALLGYL